MTLFSESQSIYHNCIVKVIIIMIIIIIIIIINVCVVQFPTTTQAVRDGSVTLKIKICLYVLAPSILSYILLLG